VSALAATEVVVPAQRSIAQAPDAVAPGAVMQTTTPPAVAGPAPAAVSGAAVPTVVPASVPAPAVRGTGEPEPSRPDQNSILESLVAAAVAGDPRARELLLTEIHPLVLRYCRGRLGRQETVIGSADDVAQEICLAVVNALAGYTVKGLSFRAFVYGIAAHKVTDAFRAIGRNRTEPMAELPDAPAAHDDPEQLALAGELAQRLGGLLHQLTPRQREVLILRVAVGLSAEETAAAVGSTPGAVRVTQHRALNRLRGVITPGDTGAEDLDPADPELA
jgi:RNA polymerase sigma-70 factor (ECF subfamily)